MTNITLEQVKKVAFLSRINFSDDELEEVVRRLNRVLHWIEKIQGVNTDNVKILVNPNNHPLAFLEDTPETDNLQEKILKNAPKAKCGYFVVPKVIE